MALARILAAALITLALGADFSPDRFGIGAKLIKQDDADFIEIGYCAPKGPAEQAGLLVGDRLLRLDDHSIQGWSFERVLDYLIRDDAAPLRITVLRGDSELSFHLVRMRLSDIAAGQNLRIEWDPKFGTYRYVPLKERRALSPGDVVALDSLIDDACRLAPIAPLDTATVVYFWASWCGPCKVLMDRVSRANYSVRLVAVNIDSACAIFTGALGKRDPPGEDRWALGPYGALSQSLGVHRRGIPSAALLGPQGRLVRIATGVDAVEGMIRYEPPSYLVPIFESAAAEFDVPVDVLISAAYVSSSWNHINEPTTGGYCGIMGLQLDTTVDRAAGLLHAPPMAVREDLRTNIRGGAALLRSEFIAAHGEPDLREKMVVLENWREVVPRVTQLFHTSVFDTFAACARGRGFGQ